MSRYPTASFPMGVKTETYKGKTKQVLSGSFVDEMGNKIIISVDLSNKYKSKKDGTVIHYGRATNIGDSSQPRKRKNQMG